MTEQDSLLAALSYIKQGFRILPLYGHKNSKCECDRECDSIGKHPRIKEWQKNASSDEVTVRQWFRRWPSSGIGIATGQSSGFFVLDIDGENGARSMAEFTVLHGIEPRTLTVVTGRGRHLYFRIQEGSIIKNSASRLAKGLDVRGEGGFVVAPPSIHKTGVPYRWEGKEIEIQQAPDWLLSIIASPPESNVRHDANKLIPTGSRNAALTSYAGKLRAQGQTESELQNHLLQFNRRNCCPPLDEEEVRAISKSVASYPSGVSLSLSELRESNPLYWFQLDVRELFMKPEFRLMDDRETGWYLRLQMNAWCGRGMLEDNTDVLWRLAGAKSKKLFLLHKEKVLFGFRNSIDGRGDPVLVNGRMARLWQEKFEVYSQTKKAGKASAAKRRTTPPSITNEASEPVGPN